jgi:hypothetical protein
VTTGRISPATEDDAALPLADDEDSFIDRSNSYWQIAGEIETHGADRHRLREKAAVDLRILMPELAACLDPSVAGDLHAVILFDLDGGAASSWHLVIADGSCTPHPGSHDRPDLTLRLTRETLVDLIFGRIDARAAVGDGSIRASGSLGLLARMPRLFPPPSR